MSQLSPESRALLDAARDADEPTFEDRARVRSALARQLAIGAAAGAAVATVTHAAAGGTVAGGVTSVAGSTVAAGGAVAGGSVVVGAGVAGSSMAAGALTTSLGAKLLVTVAFVGAVGAGTATYSHHEATKRAEATRALTPNPAPASGEGSLRSPAAPPLPSRQRGLGGEGSQEEIGEVTPVPDIPDPIVTSITTPTSTAPASPRSATAVAPATPASSSLDAELSLLQEAHAALKAHDGSRALRALGEHARRFPDGALTEEREAARVFALCALGRADEAKDVAQRFLREHPRSPLAPRVLGACDDGSTF